MRAAQRDALLQDCDDSASSNPFAELSAHVDVSNSESQDIYSFN